MNPTDLERTILVRMAQDNLGLASDFIRLGNTAAARDHIAAALQNIDSFESSVAQALLANSSTTTAPIEI